MILNKIKPKSVKGLAPLLFSLIMGCSNIDKNSDKSATVEQNPLVLTLNLDEPLSGKLGPEVRFYDFDKDSATVEQFVCFDEAREYFKPSTDILRKGVKPYFDPEGITGIRREMTKEESTKLDSMYKELLKQYF